MPLKRGIYETEYGNTCYVSGPKAKRAWDLDQAEWIPIQLVDEKKYLRPATKDDMDRRMDE